MRSAHRRWLAGWLQPPLPSASEPSSKTARLTTLTPPCLCCRRERAAHGLHMGAACDPALLSQLLSAALPVALQTRTSCPQTTSTRGRRRTTAAAAAHSTPGALCSRCAPACGCWTRWGVWCHKAGYLSTLFGGAMQAWLAGAAHEAAFGMLIGGQLGTVCCSTMNLTLNPAGLDLPRWHDS